jgi:cell division cycle protein 20 (cofactor of APC complex)
MAIKVTLTMKFDVEKFNGMNDFNLWRIRLHNLLVQQGLFKVLKGIDCLPKRMDDKDKKNIMEQALSAIQLCLSNEVMRKVIEETTIIGLWIKLETLYMNKSLMN